MQNLICSRCGREIEKRGECKHCFIEEGEERSKINWRELSTIEVIRKDEALEKKYKNAGKV